MFSASLPVFTRGLGQTLPDFAPHPTGEGNSDFGFKEGNTGSP